MAIRTVAAWWDEIAESHQPFFFLWGETTTNDIAKIRKPQTRLRACLYGLGYPRQPSSRDNFTERQY